MKISQIRGKLRINSKPIPSQANEEGVETERERPKEFSKAKRQSTSLKFRKKNEEEGRGHWFNSSVQHHNLTRIIYGFYLKFADNSGTTATTLGIDSCGNSNNYTPYGFSVASA